MRKITYLNVCEELRYLLYDENFISTVRENSIEIKESNARGADKLQKLVIRDIPCSDEQIIWRINFEKYITGLSKVERTNTVEIALAILKESVLNVYLIEMKTMIKEKGNKSTLLNLKKKIEDSISRFYYLLCMGIPVNPDECKDSYIKTDWEKFSNSDPNFYGIICYNKKRIKDYVKTKETERMYEILNRSDSGKPDTVQIQLVSS